MYLTITTTHVPATDLGYLLHKRPGKLHSLSLSFGQAYIFYPEATQERCTAALLIEIDPIALVRKPVGPPAKVVSSTNTLTIVRTCVHRLPASLSLALF